MRRLCILLALAAIPMYGPVAGACVQEPFFALHPDQRSIALLVTPTADTLFADWGDVEYRRTAWQPRSLRNARVYGQVAEAVRVAGPGGANLALGRVVLVPWFYDPTCATVPWQGSAAWLPAAGREAVVGRIRRTEDWVDGLPTVDVFRPELVRGSGMLPGASRLIVETAETLFAYYAAAPSRDGLQRDPWGAVAPLRAWVEANPEAASRIPLKHSAASVFLSAASEDVRSLDSPLAGTYRLEIERTGGPTHVFYGRTESRPSFALRAADTSTVVLDQPPGYGLRFTLSGDVSSLPRPGPGRRHRNAYGGNTAANSHIDVRLPGIVSADGTRRFQAYVLLVNFGYYFRSTDRALYEWDYEWFRRTHAHAGPNVYAEFTVSPDGRVTFTQRQELAPDRVITLRGERISSDAWQCARERC